MPPFNLNRWIPVVFVLFLLGGITAVLLRQTHCGTAGRRPQRAGNALDQGDNWRVQQGWAQTNTVAHTGNASFFADADQDSLQLVDKLDLTDAVAPVLTFWENFAAGEGQLLLSIDNGLNWQPVYTRTIVTIGWEQASIDLSPFIGKQVQLAFYLPNAEAKQAARIKNIVLAKSDVPTETTAIASTDSPRQPWVVLLLLLPALAMTAPAIKRRTPTRRTIIIGMFMLLCACLFWIRPSQELKYP